MDQQDSPQPTDQHPLPPAGLPEFPMARPIALPAYVWAAEEPPSPPHRPRVWTVFSVLIATIVITLVLNGIVLFIVSTLHGYDDPRRYVDDLAQYRAEMLAMLAMLAASMCAIFLGGFLPALASPVPWRERLQIRRPRMSYGRIIVAALGTIAISWTYSMLEMLNLIPASETLQELNEAMAGAAGASLTAAVIVVGIMPGICEEILFRGYMQTRLTQRWGPAASILITSVAFGAYHMDLWQGVYAVFVGIFLGFVAHRAGSIVPAMIAHTANNTVYVLLGAWTSETEEFPAAWAAVLLVVGVAVFLICLLLVRGGPEPVAVAAIEENAEPQGGPSEPPHL